MQDVMLFDGGMGQELVKRNKSQNDPLWSSKVLMEDLQLVINLHKEFLDSGSSVLTLNSYACTPQRLKRFGQESLFEKLQKKSIQAAKIAKESNSRYKDSKIAGCLPPLEGSYKSKLSISKNEAAATYKDIVEIQKNEVDFFICETMSSIEEALIAYETANISGKPIFISFCVTEQKGDVLLSGEKLFDACHALNKKNVTAFAINCCQFEVVEKSLEVFKQFSLPFGVLPNGFKTVKPLKPGMSVDLLEKRIDVKPSMFVEYAMKWIESGCGFVGGCCEIGPEFIKLLSDEIIRKKLNIKNLI